MEIDQSFDSAEVMLSESQLDRIERKLDEIIAFKEDAETKLSGLMEGGGVFSMFGKMFGAK